MTSLVLKYKYLMLPVAVCFLSVFCFLQEAWAAEWVLLGKTRVGTFYFDKKSIKDVSDTVKSVQTKIIFSKDGRIKEIEWGKKHNWPVKKINQYRKLSHRIESHEFDCGKKRHRFVLSEEYSLKGGLLERTDFRDSVFLPLSSGTMEEDLWSHVCRKKEN